MSRILLGPVSLSEHYSSIYDKHIYIFGDRHDKKTTSTECKNGINIVDFLEEILSSVKPKDESVLRNRFATRPLPSKIIDIFLEESKNELNSKDCYLLDVINKYRKYIRHEEKSNYLRVHWTDMRPDYELEDKIFDVIYNHLLYVDDYISLYFSGILLGYLSDINTSYSHIKINKQLNNISDAKTRTTIKSHFDLTLSKDKISEAANILKKAVNTPEEKNIS